MPALAGNPRGEMNMRVREIICFGVGAMLAASAVFADEVTIVSNVLGPEGPLYIDGNLYYVGWISSTLSKWDGKTNIVLNSTVGCGHNGLALTKQKTFLLACDDEHGAILELDMNGKELRRWEVDSTGQKLDGGINDIVVTANGGAHATLSGPFVHPPVAVMGKILYLLRPAARNGSWWRTISTTPTALVFLPTKRRSTSAKPSATVS
jgi:gluconolactonase